jgi:hypothetical protein
MKVFVFVFDNGAQWREDRSGCTVVVCAPDVESAEKEARTHVRLGSIVELASALECAELDNTTYDNECNPHCLFYCPHSLHVIPTEYVPPCLPMRVN